MKELKPGKLVRFIGRDGHFFVAGKDPMDDRNAFPVKEGMIGIHIRTNEYKKYEEVLFDQTIVTMGSVYLEVL